VVLWEILSVVAVVVVGGVVRMGGGVGWSSMSESKRCREMLAILWIYRCICKR
jgi:hypothetical protein